MEKTRVELLEEHTALLEKEIKEFYMYEDEKCLAALEILHSE